MTALLTPHTRGTKIDLKNLKTRTEEQVVDMTTTPTNTGHDLDKNKSTYSEWSGLQEQGRSRKRKNNDRRKCIGLLRQFDAADPSSLNSRQEASLKWARGIAREQNITLDKRPMPVKRQRSTDDPPMPKRSKPLVTKNGNRTFADAVKDSMVMAIINKGDVDGNIPRGKWSLIENALSSVYSQVTKELPGPPLRCRNAGWYQSRIKLMAFGDNHSIECYKSALKMVGEVWPGAALELVNKEDIPSSFRAHAWIPSIPSDKESIIGRLKECNPELPTGTWKVARLDEVDGARRHAVFILNAESVPQLQRIDGLVSYGFNTVRLKLYKSDLASKTEDSGSENHESRSEESLCLAEVFTTEQAETGAPSVSDALPISRAHECDKECNPNDVQLGGNDCESLGNNTLSHVPITGMGRKDVLEHGQKIPPTGPDKPCEDECLADTDDEANVTVVEKFNDGSISSNKPTTR